MEVMGSVVVVLIGPVVQVGAGAEAVGHVMEASPVMEVTGSVVEF